MSDNKNRNVVNHPDGWAVKGAGNNKATKVTPTAINVVQDIACKQKSDTRIHGANDKIRAGNSNGNDPHPPKDRN